MSGLTVGLTVGVTVVGLTVSLIPRPFLHKYMKMGLGRRDGD